MLFLHFRCLTHCNIPGNIFTIYLLLLGIHSHKYTFNSHSCICSQKKAVFMGLRTWSGTHLVLKIHWFWKIHKYLQVCSYLVVVSIFLFAWQSPSLIQLTTWHSPYPDTAQPHPLTPNLLSYESTSRNSEGEFVSLLFNRGKAKGMYSRAGLRKVSWAMVAHYYQQGQAQMITCMLHCLG